MSWMVIARTKGVHDEVEKAYGSCYDDEWKEAGNEIQLILHYNALLTVISNYSNQFLTFLVHIPIARIEYWNHDFWKYPDRVMESFATTVWTCSNSASINDTKRRKSI